MKHTKGPWHYNTDTVDIDNKSIGVHRPGEPCKRIFVTHDGTRTGIKQSSADAKLIAAAPEMLEALSIIINNLYAMQPEFSSELDKASYKACKDAAHAAINKAKGGAK